MAPSFRDTRRADFEHVPGPFKVGPGVIADQCGGIRRRRDTSSRLAKYRCVSSVSSSGDPTRRMVCASVVHRPHSCPSTHLRADTAAGRPPDLLSFSRLNPHTRRPPGTPGWGQRRCHVRTNVRPNAREAPNGGAGAPFSWRYRTLPAAMIALARRAADLRRPSRSAAGSAGAGWGRCGCEAKTNTAWRCMSLRREGTSRRCHEYANGLRRRSHAADATGLMSGSCDRTSARRPAGAPRK
jgi:hypothetical protein